MSQYPEFLPDEVSKYNSPEEIKRFASKLYKLYSDQSRKNDTPLFRVRYDGFEEMKSLIAKNIMEGNNRDPSIDRVTALGHFLEAVTLSLAKICVYTDLYGPSAPQTISLIEETKESYRFLLDIYCLSELDIMPEDIKKEEWGKSNANF